MARVAFMTSESCESLGGTLLFRASSTGSMASSHSLTPHLALLTNTGIRTRVMGINRHLAATGRFVTPNGADRVAQTLSIWTALQYVFAFAYAGDHAEALRRRKDWFLKGSWPTYAAWWVADDCWPQWEDANTRLEHLHDHGKHQSYAFDFRSPFPIQGRPLILDQTPIAALQRS